MRKILYLSVAVLMSVITLHSCSDFLAAENKGAGVSADEYFSSEEGVNSFRATAYSGLKPLVTTTDMNEWGTDIYIAVRGKDPGAFHRYSLTAEDATVRSFYVNAYSMINNANGVIMYGGKDGIYADEAIFLRNYGYYLLTQQFGGVPYITDYINTAKRNYPRTSLDSIYTCMITELEGIANSANLPDKSEGENLGRVSKRAVAALLAKVYLAAGWDIQTTLQDASKGTYTVLSTDYFKKAAEWADKAIDNQTFSLSFAKKWSPFNENNEEEIFSVQYQRENYPGDILSGGHGLQNSFGCQYGDAVGSGLKGCGNTLVPSSKAIYLWDKGDARWDGTFMGVMYNPHKDESGVAVWSEGYYAYYNSADTAKLNIALAYFPYYTATAAVQNWITTNKTRFENADRANMKSKVVILSDPMVRIEINEAGVITETVTEGYVEGNSDNSNASVTVKKYDDPNTEQDAGNSNLCYRDIVIFHLSDMYLVSAEAHLMAGEDGKALEKINSVRLRSGATNLASFASYEPQYIMPETFGEVTSLDVILDEKARELFGENEGRWVDLRRTKQLVRYNLAYNEYTTSVSDMSSIDGKIKWLRPIPAAEISSNDGISSKDQNPGY